MHKRWLRLLNLQPMMQSDGGAGAGGGDAGGGQGDGGTGGQGGQGGQGGADGAGSGGGQQGMTPEQIQALIADERKKWEDEAAEKAKRDQMSAEEKAKAERDDFERKAKEATETANKKLVQAEAKVQAAGLGVKPERLDFVLKLASLDGVKVDDAGTVDTAAAKAAIEAVLVAVPELKGDGNGNPIGGGTNTGGAGGGQLSPAEEGKKIAEERMKSKAQAPGEFKW